eukprot:11877774-Ditylum_brightwellii.AAC.1
MPNHGLCRFCMGLVLFVGADSQQAPGKMFVDDKNLMHNGKRPDSTAKELMTYVTHDVSLWD